MRAKKWLLACFIMVALPGSVVEGKAQVDPGIEAAIHRLFAGMRAGDSSMVAAVLSEECMMATVKDQEGRGEVLPGSRRRFLEAVAGSGMELDERISGLDIRQDGPLANAWMSYEFYLDGTLHHRGVNEMILVKGQDGWQIRVIMDTRR